MTYKTQPATMTPKTQLASKTNETQPASKTHETQPASKIPKTQPTTMTPWTQLSTMTTKTEPATMTLKTQQTTMTPKIPFNLTVHPFSMVVPPFSQPPSVIPVNTITVISNDAVPMLNIGIYAPYYLSNEILEIILGVVLESAGFSWPNHICVAFKTFQRVNKRFRAIAVKLVRKLPRVHIPDGTILGRYVSVRSLIKMHGLSSGLATEVKNIVSHKNWANSWLALRSEKYGWFIILAIVWRKKKN
ncbi:predicted protein [Nematostella vectensis]|uniref:Uncharacterized protein n=1 Tax=Nematostella vectensis TaxID=45351 RepID=A7SNC5_NEMVE|nr:predicted protein [Nematostella vectensis]|eukprot:XP_001626857.1 predicted protein [Nematostella vectensis]